MNRQSLQVVRIAYPNQSLDSALSAPENQQLVIHSIAAVNGIASVNSIGVGHTLPPSQLVLTTTVAGVASVVELPLTAATSLIGTTNNDAISLQSKEPFGIVMMSVSQAATGSPVYAYQYWNGAWVTLAPKQMPDFSTTGTKAVVFDPPIDWTTDSSGYYSIRIVATTAPSTAIQATAFKVGTLLSYRESIASKGELLVRFETRQLLLQQGEEIIGFFAFPSASNTMEASYQINP